MRDIIEEILTCNKCKLSELQVNNRKNREILFDKENFVAGKKIVVVAQNPSYWRNTDESPVLSSKSKYVDVFFIKTMKKIGFDRNDIYATNIVKCSTYNNEPLTNDVINSCKDFLVKEINYVKPKIIIALGSFAAAFFDLNFGETKNYNSLFVSARVLAARHPSYAIRRGWSITMYAKEFTKLNEMIK